MTAQRKSQTESYPDRDTRKELDVFSSIRGWASPELLEFLDQAVLLLPEEMKYRLKKVLDTLPAEGDNMQKILELVRSQWRDIQYEEGIGIAVVGPAQTGKSSLVRAIQRRQGDPTSIFSIVDTQGLDEFLGYGVGRSLPEEVRQADMILLLLDGRYALSESTIQMYERLSRLGKSLLVVLNKIDLVEKPRQVVREAKRFLGTNVFSVSTNRPASIDRLLKAIVATEPKALYPLTRAFPAFRRAICHGIVTQSSFAAGVVGAVPIPVSDMLPLTAIQTAMILKVARAFGFPLNRARARELIPALTAGALVREGAHGLRRRFPDQGALIAVAAAGGWTFALGKATVFYFERVSDLVQGVEPVPIRSLREI